MGKCLAVFPFEWNVLHFGALSYEDFSLLNFVDLVNDVRDSHLRLLFQVSVHHCIESHLSLVGLFAREVTQHADEHCQENNQTDEEDHTIDKRVEFVLSLEPVEEAFV